jgi:sulfate permease, SulP family
MDAVEEVRAKLAGRGVAFAFARVKHDVLAPLQTYGLADRVGADRLFPTLPAAEAAYRAWEGEQADGPHRPPPADAQPDARADSPASD